MRCHTGHVLFGALLAAVATPAWPGGAAMKRSGEGPGHGLETVSPAACMPRRADYSFLWWAYGPPASACNHTRVAPRHGANRQKLLCVQTGRYGMAIDAEKVKLLALGLIRGAKGAAEAVAENNAVVLGLPGADLELAVTVGGRKYTCVRGAADPRDKFLFPVRIIESGRFCQRFDIHQLVFRDGRGERLKAQGRLEITAWPDLLSFLLEVAPDEDQQDATLAIRLDSQGIDAAPRKAERRANRWRAGQKLTVAAVCPFGTHAESQVHAEAQLVASGETVAAAFDPAHGWLRFDMPNANDDPYRMRLRLTNPSGREQAARLLLAQDRGVRHIVGLTPMLRDAQGHPTGILVQLSKNWHSRRGRRTLYDGAWFHGFSMLRLPPRSTLDLELTIAYARWGGVPAASHAQLCLIGWGHNQLWNQVAIGSWGEHFCYEPDGGQQRCMIDDVRPLMVWGMNAKKRKWTWTNNVGGGDFLVYVDANGRYQHLKQMRTHYQAHGPNLTDVTYAGVSADGHIAARIQVSTPRCDDVARAWHRCRYDVREPTPFRRLAFYQLGSDNYLWHKFGKIARGNEHGVLEEWTPRRGGLRYDRQGIPCPGAVPWFSLHEAENRDTKGGAWANRGLILRSWKARLGGKDAPPFASVFRVRYPSANIELSPPPGIRELLPGDFVEAEIEFVVVPMAASDYYGPNQNLAAALKAGANTWKPVHRLAVGNQLKIKTRRGTLLHNYPIVIRVDGEQTADFEVTGGIGYVPITFVALARYRGCQLWQDAGTGPALVDQAVLGNDFWQTGHDPATRTWRTTYNVPLDTPNDAPRTVRFVFR